MHYYILVDLGKGKINSAQAGFVYDLISFVEVAGTTHNELLSVNEYYKRAVEDWQRAQDTQRQRFISQKGG